MVGQRVGRGAATVGEYCVCRRREPGCPHGRPPRAGGCAFSLILVLGGDRRRRLPGRARSRARDRSPAAASTRARSRPAARQEAATSRRQSTTERRLPRHARPARPPPGEAARGPEAADPGGHRDRGPTFYDNAGVDLQSIGPGVRRERRQGRGRAGRLDHHPAADQEPGLQEPEAGPRPQDPGGRARGPAQRRVVQEPHPRGVPEHRLLRPGLVRREGRGRALLRDSRSSSSTWPVRAARRLDHATPRATTRSLHPNRRSPAAVRRC